MNISPIIIFAFNRPVHLKKTIEALKLNLYAKDSNLIICSDGPRSTSDIESINKVRKYIRKIDGFKSVQVIEHDKNQGLARAIIGGVTEALSQHDRIIVLEDDLVVSPFFLEYMNEALKKYEKTDSVISIHGYCFPIEGLPETFFLKGADCLGWATWSRGWKLFDENPEALYENLKQKKLIKRFNMYGAYDYEGLLRRQINGENSSWAVRWYGSAILNDKLTLNPGRSLVSHIGSDGSGTNYGSDTHLDVILSKSKIIIGEIDVIENQMSFERIKEYMRKMCYPTVTRRMYSKLKYLIKSGLNC